MASRAGSRAVILSILLTSLATSALSAASLPVTIESPSAQAPYRQPQVAISGSQVGITWGTGNSIRFARSTDGGQTFGQPVTVAETGVLSLGMHRGPRIVMTPSAIVIAAIYGDKGKGADGDLVAFRSTDGGRTWSKGARVNDKAAAAREGLHAIAADGNFLYAAWLDDRNGGKELYGASSTDGGATWSANRRIYQSPDGHICECCHPSVAVSDGGKHIYAMYRNWLNGSRDFYLAESNDGGQTFTARKMGEGTWRLNACPMDGGSLIVDARGPLTVWRRESTVFLSRPGAKETEVASGKNPAMAGRTIAWSGTGGLFFKQGTGESQLLDAAGAFPAVASDGRREVIVWEANGRIKVKVLSDQ